MDFKKSFGELIRVKRNSEGLSLGKVSAELDIDNSTLNKIERGERLANLKFVNQLSFFLKLTPNDMIASYFVTKISSSLFCRRNI